MTDIGPAYLLKSLSSEIMPRKISSIFVSRKTSVAIRTRLCVQKRCSFSKDIVSVFSFHDRLFLHTVTFMCTVKPTATSS